MESNTLYCDDLLQRMRITRGARYNAYRRLKKKHDLSKATIAFLSSYTLIINSLKFASFIHLKPYQYNYISFFTIVISVFILALSLLDSSKDYKTNADRLYISAIEIENLYNELKKSMATSMSQKSRERLFNAISSAYGRILHLYQVNHELIDYYLLFNKKKKATLQGNISRRYVYIKAFVFPYMLYNLMIFCTPPLFFVFLFML
jgi:hypothetical protein